MSRCFFIKEPTRNGNGGGNLLSARSLIVRRSLAMGDALAATVVADRLIELGFDVTYQTHPACHCILRYHPLISKVTEPVGYCDVDLDGAYEKDPLRRMKHFFQMFMGKASEQLVRYGVNLGEPLNLRPRLVIPYGTKEATRTWLSRWPRPWVFICPRSESFNVRQVPDGLWREAAEGMNGTKFWLGRHPAPPGIVDLKATHFDHVINWLSVADLLVSVDTGPLHVAAAMGVQCLALGQSSSPELHLSSQSDFQTISCGLDCENCQQNVCPKNSHLPPCQSSFDAGKIAAWVNSKLRRLNEDSVSAVVSVYRPKVEVLNQCLSALLPQVSEIVVTAEANSLVPAGALRDPKIRYVQTNRRNIGYSGNANFGARNSIGRWLLFINDDCFLHPQAVERMRAAVKPDTGIISNLLRYPDGGIYHSGKDRGPGQMGWGHRDHRMRDCTLKEPTEMENVCGCCILTRRSVFYDVGGFDEEMGLFAQDDAYCLSVRRAGWKILFVPHSEGVHMEHQSVVKVGNLIDLLNRDNSVFRRKWGKYLEHNKNRIPGTFDY